MTVEYEIAPWEAMSGEDRLRWVTFRDASPSLRSPYFDLAWFDAVAAVRSDVVVLRALRHGVPIAFLPLHRGRLGGVSPVGGPFSDWHGVVAAPGAMIDLRAAFGSMRLGAFAFHGGPGDDGSLAPFAGKTACSHLIDLSRGYDAWIAERGRALHGVTRAQKKLAKEGHEVEVRLDDASPEAFDQLLAWKGAQFRDTGQFDQLSLTWTRELLARIACTRAGGFGGLVSSLRIDGRLAAVHLGMVSASVLHYWFPAYDGAFARFAPGALLLREIAREGAARGITEIDLGKGDYRYKLEFSNAAAPLVEGLVPSPRLSAGAVARTIAARAARLPFGPAAQLPERALRRLSHVAALREGEANLRPVRA